MVRPPSKHGLERKYKSWRRGKSENASSGDKLTKAGSLKNQLRSQKRFLAKLGDKDDEETNATREKIEAKIMQIEQAISDKNQSEKEKKIATKYHQVKFFERQKLTRIEKKTKKRLDEAKAAADFEDVKKYTEELEQICLDQLYVAFYPNDKKYKALFANGERTLGTDHEVAERDKILDEILKRLKNGEIDKSKSWVNLDFIKAKDFKIKKSRKRLREDEKESSESTRKVSKQYIESNVRAEAEKQNQQSNIDSNDNDVTERKKTNMIKQNAVSQEADGSGLLSASSSDEEVDIMDTFKGGKSKVHGQDRADDDIGNASINPTVKITTEDNVPTVGDSSSDSSSSDESDSDSENDSNSSDSETNDKKRKQKDHTHSPESHIGEESGADSEDDFFVDASEGNEKDVFANASKLSTVDQNKGDKSKGWATQKQRPGEWKKGHDRRNKRQFP